MAFQESIEQAIKILRQSGIILYPTDTIWGIGCDATLSEPVKKIYRLLQT
jgi:L-threonylcarbamoyladenylate synthase